MKGALTALLLAAPLLGQAPNGWAPIENGWNEIQSAPPTGTVTTTGTLASGQVALVSGATSITGDSGCTWTGTGASFVLTLPAMTPGGTSGLYGGAAGLVRRFQASLGAGGQSVGENLFVGASGNSTMTNGAGSTNFASYNTSVGDGAFVSNTTGQYNSALGHGALNENTSGSFNMAIGGDSLRHNTTGANNVAIGVDTLFRNTSGSKSVAIGTNALNANVAGEEHTAVGMGALISMTGGVGSTAIGYGALSNYVSGYEVTAVGYTAGGSLTGSNFSTFLGDAAGNHASQKVDAYNSMALGHGSYTTKDNQIVIGDSGITETVLRGTVILSGIQYLTGTRPTCDASARGTTWYVAGGTGVADTFEVCRKDGADAYAWVTLF